MFGAKNRVEPNHRMVCRFLLVDFAINTWDFTMNELRFKTTWDRFAKNWGFENEKMGISPAKLVLLYVICSSVMLSIVYLGFEPTKE